MKLAKILDGDGHVIERDAELFETSSRAHGKLSPRRAPAASRAGSSGMADRVQARSLRLQRDQHILDVIVRAGDHQHQGPWPHLRERFRHRLV